MMQQRDRSQTQPADVSGIQAEGEAVGTQTQTTFTAEGTIPPVATVSGTAAPSASQRAFEPEPESEVDLIVRESGLAPEVIARMQGNEELARFAEAVRHRQQAKARLAQIEQRRDQERAGFSDPRRVNSATEQLVQQAHGEVGEAYRDFKWRKEMLESQARKIVAQQTWQAGTAGGVDYAPVAEKGAATIESMYGRPSGDMQQVARQVVKYRVGQVRSLYPQSPHSLANNDFYFDAQPMGSGEPLTRVVSAVAALADAEDGKPIGARYNHLMELQQRGFRIVVDDPEFSNQWTRRDPHLLKQNAGFAYWFEGDTLHICNMKLMQTKNTVDIPADAIRVSESSPLSTAGGASAYMSTVQQALGLSTRKPAG